MVAEPTERKDWATDYDIFDPEYIKEPYDIWDDLRQQCPVAHSERWQGSWLPTRYEDVFAIAQDFNRFSSQSITVTPVPITQESSPDYGVRAPPISSDRPEHTWARRLILARLQPAVRREVGTRHPRTLPIPRRRFRRQGSRRRRRELRTADSRPRHRRNVRHTSRHVRHVHRLGPRRSRARPSGPRYPHEVPPVNHRLLPRDHR